MKRIIITKLDNSIIFALYDDLTMIEVNLEDANCRSVLDNIYIGKVKKVVKNINAAFIDIGINKDCYYSYEDNSNPIFVKGTKNPRPCVGDEIIVQVSKEANKLKAPSLSSSLRFSGNYVLVTTGEEGLGVSRKIGSERKSELESLISQLQLRDTSIIVRTNAAAAANKDIITELKNINQIITNDIENWKHRTCFSLLWQSAPAYLTLLKNISLSAYDEILTDDEIIFSQLKEFIQKNYPAELSRLKLYNDTYPLIKLYSMEKNLKEALSKRIWLKSGAFLIIEPTEALTVIDVNSGKNVSRKNKEENIMSINKEAATEIIRQLRLRNLSGIILIDFIDMYKDEYKNELISYVKELASSDPTGITVFDITRLGLMELTRKKIRKPLHEQICNKL